MIKKPFLFVANWKMNMPLKAARAFVVDNCAQLHKIAQADASKTIVLCPSFVSLGVVYATISSTAIKMGAQDCSPHESGAYTGEVDALSLRQAGCSYAIVGHSERRAYFGETDEVVAKKVEQLLDCSIEPIVCIGETQHEYENKQTFELLARQLRPVLHVWVSKMSSGEAIPDYMTIAYEPVWSIGTGLVPDAHYLTQVFDWIVNECERSAPELSKHVRLLYGGSVSEHNASEILRIPFVGGLLIGGASLDFQKFQNIVLLKV